MATAALSSQRDGMAASTLLGEIARATVVPPEPLPPNAVVTNCDVEVRDNIKKAIKHLRIVLPRDEDRGQHGVSVLTPIGAALAGLSEGASIEWCTPARDRRSFTVLRVRHWALKNRTSGPRISMRE
jgi:regulator of nucleoside diphosphate kinase